MLSISFVLSILIQVVLPIFLGFYIIRRYQTSWRLFAIGALALIVFQLVQGPALGALGETDFYRSMASIQPVVLAITLSLITAILEVAARFGAFWYTRKTSDQWGGALTVAFGHGGAESLLIGLQFLINFIFALQITTNGVSSLNLSAQETVDLQAQIDAFWNLAWYLPLAAALQRMAALAIQVALGVMVWMAVTRRAWVWLVAAVLWQTAMGVLSLVLATTLPDLANSVLFLFMLVVNAGIVIFLARKLPSAPLTAFAFRNPKPVKE
jgi:uncharacterized membrane protein YhfC